jgi:hypothetical protein
LNQDEDEEEEEDRDQDWLFIPSWITSVLSNSSRDTTRFSISSGNTDCTNSSISLSSLTPNISGPNISKTLRVIVWMTKVDVDKIKIFWKWLRGCLSIIFEMINRTKGKSIVRKGVAKWKYTRKVVSSELVKMKVNKNETI